MARIDKMLLEDCYFVTGACIHCTSRFAANLEFNVCPRSFPLYNMRVERREHVLGFITPGVRGRWGFADV